MPTAQAPSASSRKGKRRPGSGSRSVAVQQPPVCGFTLDGRTCKKRGDHRCKPRAEKVVAFFRELLVHTKGRWARHPFELEPWQAEDIVRPLFGRVRWDHEAQRYVRRYSIAWVEVARKNGKSELMAGIALYLLVADDEESAEVYGCAKDRDQAAVVFDVAKRMVELSPVLSKRLSVKAQQKRIIDERTASVYAVVAADAGGNLGLNPHGIIFDEVLTQPNGDLWEAMKTGMGSRDQPLMVAATTAGDDPSSFAKSEHDEMLRVIEDPDRAPHVFAYIRNVPMDADPWDESNWTLGNPALGSFLRLEVLRQEAMDAKHNRRKENSFRQFRLNQWVSQTTRYISMDEWKANTGDVALTPDWLDERQEGKIAWGGLDLSSKLDLTAWCLLFEDGSVRWRLWIPEDMVPTLDKHTDDKFGEWVKEGWVTATEGNVIDYARVYDDIEEDCARFAVASVTYDKWCGEPVRQALMERTGLEEWIESSTTYDRMTAPMKELMRGLKAGEFAHGGNPVLAWMADSLEAKSPTDDPERVRPVKPVRDKTGKRIDGLVAFLLSIDGRLTVDAEELPEADIF